MLFALPTVTKKEFL